MKIRVCLILFSTAVSAAPMLRLSNSVVTVHAAVRATAASQTLQAFNAGDGTLSLSVAVTPAISWLALSILPPLTTLGGASVLVNGVATPLFYSSFGQIAFQARADTYLGTALVQVVRDGQFGNTVSVNMAQYAPGIVVVTDASYNVVDATHPVKAGATLVFWALGLGPTNPVVADGAASPSSPPALVTAQVAVQFGLEFFYNTATPSFVGLSPGSVGLYQVIATLPASTPAGTVSASLQLPGGQLSNTVTIAVQ